MITELREPPDADGTSVGASPWLGTFSEQVWALSDERHHVRTPSADGGRTSTVRRFRTYTASLRQLRDWLVAEGVTQVAMEATGVYWKPVWHVLAGAPGLELMLVNAHAVKNMPGRKTDVADAQWLAELCECGLLRPSFVPPPQQAQLRDLTRYRKKLIEERTRETNEFRSCSRTPGSSWTRWSPTSSACRPGGCSRRSSPGSAMWRR